MESQFKARYLEALRSGKYKQGDLSLRKVLFAPNGEVTSNCYCVLGVACDLVDPNGWAPYGSRSVGRFAHLGHSAVPSDYVRKVMGVTEGEFKTLTRLNDERKWTFDEIALYIEENL